jgi:hypothetical protein
VRGNLVSRTFHESGVLSLRAVLAKIRMNPRRRLSGIAHRMQDQRRTADDVAAREHARNTGHLVGIDEQAAPIIDG